MYVDSQEADEKCESKLSREVRKTDRQRVESAALMLGQLWENLLEPIGPEARLRVMNAMLHELGVQDEIPYIDERTGRPTRFAEAYHECMRVLIDYAKGGKDQPI